ncbi:hypothetical protein COU60_01010 [Candidatus Pacearchaeota archaeon CG10_big_fil_rev_8_21_14_0_10_34_76]|nr:MAG: hypothetical protein COU60_01010 [Candidatus Pacearchaeota archaeon CG10_big_fil_rev_8_21_14_0_10_34_76]
MKKKITKKEAQDRIIEFFRQAEEIEPKNFRKIKRLAMSYNIKLGNYRKIFCKECYSDIRYHKGKVRIKNMHKIVECSKCGFLNKWKI